MTKYVELNKLRPNNWFLNKEKLESVRRAWREGNQHLLPAVLVTEIDDQLSLLDGNCRAFSAWEFGAREILAEVVLPVHVRGNIELIRIMHQQGAAIGIMSIEDLGKRIISPEDNDNNRNRSFFGDSWRPRKSRP